jgi:hypothetical protein
MPDSQVTARTPYRSLLVLMVCLIILAVFPFAGRAGFLRSALFSAVVLSAVYAAGSERRTRLIGAVLGLAALVFTWIGAGETRVIGTISVAVFLAFVIGAVSVQLIRTSKVTAQTIWAGVCVYLLIPVLWTRFYALVVFANENPSTVFRGVTNDPSPITGDWMSQVSYYSFVTMTTLGFGDISPLTVAARRLTTVEAVVGQLFLAIFIARLVGLHLAERMDKRNWATP